MALTDRQAADSRREDAVGNAYRKFNQHKHSNRHQPGLGFRNGLHEAVRDLRQALIAIYAQVEGADEPPLRDELATAIAERVSAFIQSCIAGERGANAASAAREGARLIAECGMGVSRGLELAVYDRMKRQRADASSAHDLRPVIHNTTYHNSGQVAAMGPNATASNNVMLQQIYQPWNTDALAQVAVESSQSKRAAANQLATANDVDADDAIEIGHIGSVEKDNASSDPYDGLSRQLGFLLEATSGNVFHWSKLPQHSEPLRQQMPRLRELSDAINARTCKLTVLQEKSIIESAHEAATSLHSLSPVAFQVSGRHGVIWTSLTKTVSQLAKLYPFRTQAETNVARSIVFGQDDFSLHFCELVEQLLQFEEAPRPLGVTASSGHDPVAKAGSTSEGANPILAEGTDVPATVVFVLLRGIKDCTDGPKVPNALAALNCALREVDRAAFVLSTIAGLILVLPDAESLSLDHILAVLDDAPVGFPLRVGVTHGMVEAWDDVDGQVNLIGPPVNIAARLATSPDNHGLLVHETYADFADVTLAPAHWLHRDARVEVQIEGKPQDPRFRCFRGPQTFDAKPIAERQAYPFKSVVLIAYDLPKFSAGDRAQLRKRFTRLADVFKKLRQSVPMANGSAMLSPGGDGGVLVVPGVTAHDGAAIASKLRELSKVESIDHADAIAVETRIGVHYGQVTSYVNARGVTRPTGIAVFAADDIAGDVYAKQNGGIIITRMIADAITGGSRARLESEFETLAKISNGPASNLERFVQRSTNTPTGPEPGISPDPVPSSANDGASSVSSARMFEPLKTQMTSKQKGAEGKSVAPTRWMILAQPLDAATSTKAQVHRAVMGAILASDGGTGRTTRWPAVLRPQGGKEEARSDGAVVWHRVSDHGNSNVRDEEQLGLRGNGTVWFQRAYFWDATAIQIDFGQCAFDALVFLKLVTRAGNALGANRYDITLRFEAPGPDVAVTLQTNLLKSMQPFRMAKTKGTYLEATAKLGPKTSLPDHVITGVAKSLLDGVANEFELGGNIFHGPPTGPSFLEIDESSLLEVSRALAYIDA